MKKKKGSAFVWLLLVGLVFMIVFMWSIFSQAYIPTVFPATEDAISGNARAEATLDFLKLIWDSWPIIALVGLVFAGFILTAKREPDTFVR